MTGGPKLMLGTAWPSITSRWRKSQPPPLAPPSTSAISTPSLAKSAERMDAAICGAVLANGSEVIAPGSLAVRRAAGITRRDRSRQRHEELRRLRLAQDQPHEQ